MCAALCGRDAVVCCFSSFLVWGLCGACVCKHACAPLNSTLTHISSH